MPAPLSPERDPVAGAAPARRGLLRSYTCLTCGARLASWAAFRAHRAGCRVTGPQGAPATVTEAPQEVVWPAATHPAEASPESPA
jgi:hypothetical protein